MTVTTFQPASPKHSYFWSTSVGTHRKQPWYSGWSQNDSCKYTTLMITYININMYYLWMKYFSPLRTRAFAASKVREMLVKHKQFVILSTALKPPKILLNYIQKNYRPQPCLPCDYLKAK